MFIRHSHFFRFIFRSFCLRFMHMDAWYMNGGADPFDSLCSLRVMMLLKISKRCLMSMDSGGADGTRTRDLFRDREAL